MSGISYVPTGFTYVSGIFIDPTGTYLFVLSNPLDKVIVRSTMTTPWDLSTATLDSGQSVSTAAMIGSDAPVDLWISSDGTKVQIGDSNAATVWYATMSTPWDLTTFVANTAYTPVANAIAIRGVAASPSGSTLYAYDNGSNVVQGYALTTPWVLSSGVTAIVGSILSAGTYIEALYVDNTGTRLLAANYTGVQLYVMSTANDLSTAAAIAGQYFAFTEDPANITGMCFSADGTRLYTGSTVYVTGTNIPTIYQYSLSTAWDLTTATYAVPTLAQGAVTATPLVSSTAVNNTHHVTGGVSSAPVVASTATNATNHVIGAVVRTPTISAGASNPTHHAAGAVSISANIAGTESVHSTLIGAASIPVLLSTGSTTQTPVSEVTMPALQAQAIMLSGAGTGIGAATLPALSGTADTGISARVNLPIVVATAAMVSSSVSVVDVQFPQLVAVATSSNDRQLLATQVLPALTATGIVDVGATLAGVAQIPQIKSHGLSVVGTIANGSAVLPAFSIETALNQLISQGLLTANLVLPVLQTHSYLITTTIMAFSGWATNAESARTSEYSNYNYLLLTNTFGKNIGVSADGIYELVGDTDNTVPIDADVLFGLDAFRTEDLKRLKAVYLGYRADSAGDVNVQVVIDGEAPAREYTIQHISNVNGIKRGRATIAKGLKSRYWQYGIKNVAGADFMIDSMDLYVQQNNRKV